ncbi:MAG: T9SS type A sorting domain-containing protein [Sphingobacteriales bacterium]|nr:MAG: T9SS type A sorting domain-containing protein [Sphingobacteriales bacterium]
MNCKLLLLVTIFFALANTGDAKRFESVSIAHDGVNLNARIQFPDGAGPFQVVIVVPGSGPNDKDGTILMQGGNIHCLYPGLEGETLKPYLGLSEALSDSGYAVLTYDKVEYTNPNVSPITFHKLWLPVESIIAYVKTRGDIDKDNIILLGHSEGSGIVPYAGRKDASVKAVISLAGPRQPLDTILAYQLLAFERTCNGDTNAAKTQGAQVLAYFHDVRTGNYSSSTPAAFGVSAAVWADYLHVMDSVSINYNLCGTRKLFIGLGDDINVPVGTQYARFQQEVPSADFYLVPALNHYLTTANNPQTSQVLTDTIVYWLRKNVFPVAINNVEEGDFFTVNLSPTDVTVSAASSIDNAYLTNAAGAVVRKEAVNKNSYHLNLQGLATGIYYLRVSAQNKVKTINIPVQ